MSHLLWGAAVGGDGLQSGCSWSSVITHHKHMTTSSTFGISIRRLRCMSLQVPAGDNYYAALNCAVFSDGSFVYIPKGVKCPMELSTYFRINAQESGQVRAC